MSDGSRQAVTNKKKLEEIAQEMNQLLDRNSIVCCQESDGVFDQLVEVDVGGGVEAAVALDQRRGERARGARVQRGRARGRARSTRGRARGSRIWTTATGRFPG